MQLVRPKTPRPVIVDVDVGCDDAWALYILLKAMDCGLVDVLAITCVNGNCSVDNVARNVVRVLEAVGKQNEIPVYKGAVKELIDTKVLDQFHGEDGLSDLDWDTEPDVSVVRKEHAVNTMYQLVKERPGEVTVICLGPLTNLAIGLRMYGDMKDCIKEVFMMGGNHTGVGNTTKSAEFNCYLDSEAVSIVLGTVNCPITILPWEACLERSISIPMTWRKEVLGAVKSPILDILNPVEYKAFKDFKNYIPCDALVAALFIHPGLVVEANDWHVVIELSGRHTRGQMVLDHMKQNEANATIVERISAEDLKAIMLWVVGVEGQVEIVA